MSLYPDAANGSHLNRLDRWDAERRACDHPTTCDDRCVTCGAVVVDLGVRR